MDRREDGVGRLLIHPSPSPALGLIHNLSKLLARKSLQNLRDKWRGIFYSVLHEQTQEGQNDG